MVGSRQREREAGWRSRGQGRPLLRGARHYWRSQGTEFCEAPLSGVKEKKSCKLAGGHLSGVLSCAINATLQSRAIETQPGYRGGAVPRTASAPRDPRVLMATAGAGRGRRAGPKSCSPMAGDDRAGPRRTTRSSGHGSLSTCQATERTPARRQSPRQNRGPG